MIANRQKKLLGLISFKEFLKYLQLIIKVETAIKLR